MMQWLFWATGVLAGICLGLSWFWTPPKEMEAIKKQAYIQVYQSEIVCEKTTTQWFCGAPIKDTK